MKLIKNRKHIDATVKNYIWNFMDMKC